MTNKNNEESEEKGQPKQKSLFREYGEAIVIALILALFIRTFIVQAFKIPSGSMKNTLLIGDHILVTKYSYGIHIPNEIPFTGYKLFDDYHLFHETPKRWDIIVFKFPKDERRDFIKRVVALPGEEVEIRSLEVYINKKPADDPYAYHLSLEGEPLDPRSINYGPVRVPEGHVFVMGDNREQSQDSRFWGFLETKKIRGKAFMIYWSWNSEDSWIRFSRLGNLLR